MIKEEIDKYYNEIIDSWQSRIDNTGNEDVDGCDFYEELEGDEVDEIVFKFKGVALLKSRYEELLDIENKYDQILDKLVDLGIYDEVMEEIND